MKGIRKTYLYGHMTFRKPDQGFFAGCKRNLWKAFQDEEVFGFLKGDARWKRLEEAVETGL